MDIFIVEKSGADNIDEKVLSEYKKKEISNSDKLKEHCFSYLIADRILEHLYKVPNREIVFENKKPRLKSGEKYFSLSHSGDFIVLGFSDYNCGTDIEKMKERDFSKISKRMKFNANSKEEFYKEWTLYEARYKLGEKENQKHSFTHENHCITSCSTNKNEKFEIYILNSKNFSKA